MCVLWFLVSPSRVVGWVCFGGGGGVVTRLWSVVFVGGEEKNSIKNVCVE